MPMDRRRQTDAVNYLKGALGAISEGMPRAAKEIVGEIILRAYLQGREDEACLKASAETEN